MLKLKLYIKKKTLQLKNGSQNGIRFKNIIIQLYS